ncbi:MAG TPA: alpha-E domain-containing protein [Gammaproteobacteria bacterium]|nr:alpha-E domain-containing protein [Gammaproteobacteria bacterium]
MLSRVAENIYWMARYIERAENTARLINVNTHLLLDLPKDVRPGWEPLIHITGSEEFYRSLYEQAEERSVVRFLIGDLRNSSSILSSIGHARENARTIRDIIPREAWEQVNELYLNIKGQLQAGLSERRRYDYLKSVIQGAQQITGLLAGTMLHDFGYDFLRMGRNLERADMTTRIIDVRSANLLPTHAGELPPFEHAQWMSVLKSLTAYQMYRRHTQVAVRRTAVLQFLLQNRQFPRACYHCLGEVEACLHDLPRSDLLLRTVARLQRMISEAPVETLDHDRLHAFTDELQLGLADLHSQITATYFAHDGHSAGVPEERAAHAGT